MKTPRGVSYLDWPPEAARPPAADEPLWRQPGSNICLDFHGDPSQAGLVVFSDGNHHMALEGCLRAFTERHPDLSEIFYATTPPSVLLEFTRKGVLRLGNLRLSVRPHLFIGPQEALERLRARGTVARYELFMQSRGNALLVRRGNPKDIRGIVDLMRPGVRLFLSNPDREAASHRVYHDTLTGLAARAGIDAARLETWLSSDGVVYGERIHHREAPQALVDERADVALLHYHLALRCVRIFSDLFELVPLGGTADDPQPAPGNVVTQYYAGLVGDGGPWGPRLLEFLRTERVTEIYTAHGLRRPDERA